MSAAECRPDTDAESAGAPGKPVPRSTRRSKARSDAVAAEARLIVALGASGTSRCFPRARGQDEERSEELFRHRHLRALRTFGV